MSSDFGGIATTKNRILGRNQKRNDGCKYGAVATEKIRTSKVGAPLNAQKAQNFQNAVFNEFLNEKHKSAETPKEMFRAGTNGFACFRTSTSFFSALVKRNMVRI